MLFGVEVFALEEYFSANRAAQCVGAARGGGGGVRAPRDDRERVLRASGGSTSSPVVLYVSRMSVLTVASEIRGMYGWRKHSIWCGIV